MLLMMWSQFHVKNTYYKYSEINSSLGMTGAEVAQTILQKMGVNDVTVEPVAGQLSDHYDPSARAVRLSEGVYGSSSLSAAAIAAHECGHVLQDVQGYKPMNLRAALVPAANIGGQFGPMLVMGGLFLTAASAVLGNTLLNVGIVVFAAAVLFHIVTLPVEFDASRRALNIINDLGILQGEENRAAKKVLSAAAWTYVATTVSAVLQLMQLLSMRRQNNY
jgi:Zn-dependent membrane protease YugP